MSTVLLVAAAWFLVALALPLLSLARSVRVERRAMELGERLDRLERRLQELAARGPLTAPRVQPVANPVDESRGAADPASSPAGPASRSVAPASDASGRALAEGVGADRAPTAGEREAPEWVSLERRIGTRWMLYVGIGAVVLGASYFVKFAFDNQWITESMRVGIGALAGALLVTGGRRFTAQGLATFGQALMGGGLVVLALSVYAAFEFYHLIGPSLAFVLLAVTVILGAGLAHQHRSVLLAVLAVGGGYATPFLLDTLASQIPLFTYAVVLAIGTLALARLHDWPALHVVSYAGALLTVQAWMSRFYRPGDYLVTEIFFTVLALLFIGILRHTARDGRAAAVAATVVLATAPLLYHVASLSLLADHRLALLVYFIAACAVSTVWTAHLERDWLRLGAWAMLAAPFLTLVAGRVVPGWLPATIITGATIYGIHLAVHLRSITRSGAAIRPAELVLLHANGLWAFYAADALLETRALAWLPAIAAALALWNLGIARWLGRAHRLAMFHYVALAFTLGAVAIALEFDGPWVVVGWACQGAALALLGLRAGENWLRLAGGGLLVLSALGLVLLLVEPGGVGSVPVVNPRALSALFVVVVFFGLARRYAGARDVSLSGERTLFVVVGHALALGLLTAEIDTYYRTEAWRAGVIGGLGEAGLARQLTLSIGWAAYAVLLVFVGIRRRDLAVRYLAIAVFAMTIAKVVLVDLARLDRLYQIGSVLGLGVLLITASYLYQRARAGDGARLTAGTGPPLGEPASHDPA